MPVPSQVPAVSLVTSLPLPLFLPKQQNFSLFFFNHHGGLWTFLIVVNKKVIVEFSPTAGVVHRFTLLYAL